MNAYSWPVLFEDLPDRSDSSLTEHSQTTPAFTPLLTQSSTASSFVPWFSSPAPTTLDSHSLQESPLSFEEASDPDPHSLLTEKTPDSPAQPSESFSFKDVQNMQDDFQQERIHLQQQIHQLQTDYGHLQEEHQHLKLLFQHQKEHLFSLSDQLPHLLLQALSDGRLKVDLEAWVAVKNSLFQHLLALTSLTAVPSSPPQLSLSSSDDELASHLQSLDQTPVPHDVQQNPSQSPTELYLHHTSGSVMVSTLDLVQQIQQHLLTTPRMTASDAPQPPSKEPL